MTKQILVVEDNHDLAELVQLNLSDEGFRVRTVGDGLEADQCLQGMPFDLVILDLMLPGLDGLELCRRIRRRADYLPILMLTAKSTELDRVLGLEVGADDYVTKPFSIRELVARVKALFRRIDALAEQAEEEPRILTINGLEIDPDKRRVLLQGDEVYLTGREFDLLYYFATHPGRVYSRGQLLDAVWGYGHEGYEHTVNSHINRLRAKIEARPAEPDYILTVWGVGYKFAEPAHV